MKHLLLSTLFVSLAAALLPAGASAAPAATRPATTRFPRPEVKYKPGPDAERKDTVPHGNVTTFTFHSTKTFPGTVRRCAVYVPAQYDPAKPAALMVFQDGVSAYLPETGAYRTPVVLDNLIAAGELPVIVAVFVDPGWHRPEVPTGKDAPRTPDNRSFEYDTVSPAYADFLLTEILPHVESEYHLNITKDPAGRAICGQSSGGICAFNAAWHYPDQFGKVISAIGSFTNLRGGHVYPDLVRNSDPKPIRVFMEDGINDNRSRQLDRNWVLANLRMAAAFEEKDYDYKYVLGENAHNPSHAGSIFPDTLRWLWRDYPHAAPAAKRD